MRHRLIETQWPCNDLLVCPGTVMDCIMQVGQREIACLGQRGICSFVCHSRCQATSDDDRDDGEPMRVQGLEVSIHALGG